MRLNRFCLIRTKQTSKECLFWFCFYWLAVYLVGIEQGLNSEECLFVSCSGEPKAIPWTLVTPLKAAADAWCHMDIHKGDVVAWPTNLGWMMGPWLVYASLLNKASLALYDGSPLGSGFVKFVQVNP